MRGKKVIVWAGIWSSGFIGPFFLSETINGERYLQMLEEKVLPELRKSSLLTEGTIENMWAILKEKIFLRKPTNVEDLRKVAAEEWNSISRRQIQSLQHSIPRRLEAA